MDIQWYGHSCFKIMERGVVSIVTDPYNGDIGYEVPNLKADIVTISHDAPGHNAADVVKKVEHVIDRPGEFEIGGVFITGIATCNPHVEPEYARLNNIFVYDFSGFTICHLGDLDHVLTQKQIEELGPIDVLMIPVGGGGGLNSAQASEVISIIEPSIVIPMHYKTPNCNLDLDPLDKFLKELGATAIEEQPMLRIKKSSLTDETQLVVLQYTE